MSPLIRKEIRLILPFWGVAIFLAIVPAFLAPKDLWMSRVNESIFWALGFGAILLGLAPFGQEFSLGTFPSLLAQPFERRRIWATKVLLILLAALLVLIAFMMAVHFRLNADLQESMERFASPQHPVTEGRGFEDLKRSTVNFYHSEFWFAGPSNVAIVCMASMTCRWPASESFSSSAAA